MALPYGFSLLPLNIMTAKAQLLGSSYFSLYYVFMEVVIFSILLMQGGVSWNRWKLYLD